MKHHRIAIYGKSGAGKSTVAQYLSSKYRYKHCTAGKLCRSLCLELFGTEERAVLNAFNDAVRSIDSMVWIRTALKIASPVDRIVFDSMRFKEDVEYFRANDFKLWRIDCDDGIRFARLKARGQVFTPTDNIHPGEISLDDSSFDILISNQSTDTGDLFAQVDFALQR